MSAGERNSHVDFVSTKETRGKRSEKVEGVGGVEGRPGLIESRESDTIMFLLLYMRV